jgi:ferrochelatase
MRAVVLFNLGGPDEPAAVEPFLFNLFNDPAIIELPSLLRWPIARLISRRRAPLARDIYAKLGGGSPLLPETEAQARALEAALGEGSRVFIAMRYWRPRAEEAARAVKAFGPDEIVLLPLYPQFSGTTTASSLRDWGRAAAAVGLIAPTRAVCCWPDEPEFIAAQVELIAPLLTQAAEAGAPKLLLSAHGLPKRTVQRGDPYQWQVERTAQALASGLARKLGSPPDWTLCYQSRVGPLEWIGPATDGEIERAARAGRPIVVAPVVFVSEHSETLVELDIEYRHLAERAGAPLYLRSPAVGARDGFIHGLARLVNEARAPICSATGARICPAAFGRCPLSA